MELSNFIIIGGITLVAGIALGLILTRLYRRASKEVSFVRTGFGGEKIIINGGALVLPVLHEVIPVNMNTLKLEVRRAQEQALITKDRMRVDVTAEFYVRVKPSAESISTAAQTLGMKTMSPEQLKELVEGKFVDSLRAVAAEMAMEELHEKRVDFVQKVQQAVSEDLFKNGLELESVSLTGLDQTDVNYFNPQNAFDAEGLTRLTQTIESRRQARNEIEQQTDLSIRNTNLNAEQQRLKIAREEEYAKLEQAREIALRRAEQKASIAEQEAAKDREAEEAQIAAQREVELKRIAAERDTQNEGIRKQQAVEQAEVERDKAIQLAQQDLAIAVAERSKIQAEAEAQAQTASIQAKRDVETAQVASQQAVELARQQSAIAIANKSQEESEAKAAADQARAEAVVAEQSVITAEQTAQAEREKAIQLILAEQTAQAGVIEAQAQAEQQRAKAKGDADAQNLLNEAKARQYAVEAEGKQAVNEAANTLSSEQVQMALRLALLEALPGIVRESVRPMENIDGIKIVQFGGALPGAQSGAAGNGSSEQTLPNQMVNAALNYQMQKPLVQNLMAEAGIAGGDFTDLASLLKEHQQAPETGQGA